MQPVGAAWRCDDHGCPQEGGCGEVDDEVGRFPRQGHKRAEGRQRQTRTGRGQRRKRLTQGRDCALTNDAFER